MSRDVNLPYQISKLNAPAASPKTTSLEADSSSLSQFLPTPRAFLPGGWPKALNLALRCA